MGRPEVDEDRGFVAALADASVADAQAYLAEVRDWLRYDLEGTKPDAFSAFLDEVAARLRAEGPAPVCVAPPRVVSAARRDWRGVLPDLEVYGQIACCPPEDHDGTGR